MAISNTSVLIKRSSTTQTPTSLNSGELAYSYASNNIFIGTGDGQSAIAIGGYNTYQAVNQATNSNTASTLVKRDLNGAFSGRLSGTADRAVQLDTPEFFSISGGDITATAVSFNGTANVSLSASLNNVPNLNAGTYGSATQYPVITLAANGRVMSISTQAAATGGLSNFYISDGLNSNTITNDQTISFTGTKGVTALVSGNIVTVSTDSTILRSNTSLGGQNIQTVDTDLRITGNLFINGTTTQVNSTSLSIDDPIIYLAANNSVGNIIDIGFVAAYNAAGQYAHTGITRHASDGKYYIFDSYTPEPQLTNIVDPTNASFRVASLVANVTGGTVSGLKQAIGVTDGGTGANTFTQYGITFGNGAGTLGVTSAAGVNDLMGSNQILTVNSLGVPVWTTTLDGGMF